MFVDALLCLIVVGTNIIAKLLRYLSSSHWGSFKNTCFSSARILDDWLRWHAHVGMGWKPPTNHQFPGPRFSLGPGLIFRATNTTPQVDVRRQTMLILDLVSNTQDAIQQSFPAAGKLWKWAKWGSTWALSTHGMLYHPNLSRLNQHISTSMVIMVVLFSEGSSLSHTHSIPQLRVSAIQDGIKHWWPPSAPRRTGTF